VFILDRVVDPFLSIKSRLMFCPSWNKILKLFIGLSYDLSKTMLVLLHAIKNKIMDIKYFTEQYFRLLTSSIDT